MSQILGYTGPVSASSSPTLKARGYLPDDLIGKAGVEASYETELRGVYGTESVERDASRPTDAGARRPITERAAGRFAAR